MIALLFAVLSVGVPNGGMAVPTARASETPAPPTALYHRTIAQVVSPGEHRSAPPTVGDTIWIERTVQVPAQSTVRPADWDPPDPIEVLGRPRVVSHETAVDVMYPIAVWRAGAHRIEIPGPLVLGPGGTVDSLPPQKVTVTVASVLPDAPADSPLAPQPRAELVPRRTVSLVPAVVLWIIAALLLLPLHRWWRRRGKPAVTRPSIPPPPGLPVERWAEAGEQRAIAAAAVTRVRAAMMQRVPGIAAGAETDALLARACEAQPAWPIDEARDLLGALDRARFGWISADDALNLYGRAADLERRLEGMNIPLNRHPESSDRHPEERSDEGSAGT